MEGGTVHCIQCSSVTIGESLQQKMLKNHWKMKVSVNMGGPLQQEMLKNQWKNMIFHRKGVTQPPPHPQDATR